jgi:beta-barrel assembly-enhancing protease
LNIKRKSQISLLVLSLLVSSLPVTGFARRPVALPAPAPAKTNDTFKFGKVDLDLLEQVNLLDQRFDKEGLVYHNGELEAYLDRVGQKVVADKNIENVNWKFQALRDPTPNAFALPNGSIYINTGLLAVLDDEAQLAGVLAHEATHVSRRHSYVQNRSIRKKVLAINILNTIGSWNPVGGVAGTAIGLIATISPFMLVLSVFGYSRELEKEADVEGLKNLTAAGYQPDEMVNVIKVLQKDIEGEQISSFYNDHPKLQERVNYLSNSIGSTANKPSEDQLKAARAEYLAKLELADRQDVELAILDERFRTAVFVSQKLVDFRPDQSANVYYLAESYRALGPRTPELTAKELTGGEKKKAAKNRRRQTLDEQDAELMKTVAGQQAWKTNQEKAEQLYLRALELNQYNYLVHRGLGMLYEKIGRKEEAISQYRKYIELAPREAADMERFRRRLQTLRGVSPDDTSPTTPPQEKF